MDRRSFLRLMGQGIAAASLPGCLAARGLCGPSSDQRPNIILIMADDMGFSDLRCYGSEIDTPNLDRLAAGGVRFTQFYNAARCCPTRASLLTGLYPHQAGVGEMIRDLGTAPYQGYLNTQCVTIAEALKGAGYRTYMSGKWHVGEEPPYWPRKRGFDRYFGLISGGSSYFELLEQPNRKRLMAIDDTPYKPQGDDFYMTDAFSDYAVQFIAQHNPADGPFFLYLPYTAPHWPLHALPEDIAKYEGAYMKGWDVLRRERYARMVRLGIIDPKWPLSPRDPEVPAWEDVEDKAHWDRLMAVYAAMIDRMDQGIGRVLAELEAVGAYDNTLILFLADNGGCAESIEGRRLNQPGTLPGERGSYVAYKRPWANASDTPFRMFKKWAHEGGIATPLIAHWPAGIEARDGITHEVGHLIDIMPTCLDVARAEYPASFNGNTITRLEGKSLLPVLEGGSRKRHETLYWEHIGNRAVRHGKWKLVAGIAGDWELYDMEADRTELHDLATEYPEKAKEISDLHEKWAWRCGVYPLPPSKKRRLERARQGK
jgi:arylsulfatase